ncbi:retron system putative HNH endonuclease [Ferrimonas gelatinilytica]|uniref:TIGR02646 family protein n=1 Tax=Ferrimonas gelatinilytica TaxID=1255257 RepID=A0ABP9RTX9_9GAMM
MRQITKSREPQSLTQYKQQGHASYAGLPQQMRTDLKNSLLTEQGMVCAYCMQRIKSTAMRVEHWASQDEHPGLQLSYSNMLACCTGNEGQPKDTYTCDKLKGNDPLTYSPAKPLDRVDSRIRYLDNGKIKSTNVAFDTELNQVLNLNETRLVANRRAAVDALKDRLARRAGARTKDQLRAYLAEVTSKNAKNQLKPFWGAMAYYLEKRINR